MTDAQPRTTAIIEGEHAVSSDPATVLSTLLGSCVAVCLHDPVASVGGMNHFLLPGEQASHAQRRAERFGAHLMEALINDLMMRGARRERLQAKIFGGANILRGLSDVGAQNAAFAKRFLHHEGIRIIAEDLGGARARRVQFWPASGRSHRLCAAPDWRRAGGDKDLFS
jgi:chemotaxis protein CheD